MGSFKGSLSTVPATKLGSIAIKGAIEKAGRDLSIFYLSIYHKKCCILLKKQLFIINKYNLSILLHFIIVT